jgi:antitoxin component YwqK of YwqJK toxin-antitoxin module
VYDFKYDHFFKNSKMMRKATTIFTTCLLTLAGMHTADAQTAKVIVHSKSSSEGLYVVSDVDEEKFGYDRYDNGREVYVEVIPLKYEGADDFDNGLAQVKLHGKWGVIDRNENVIVPFRYDNMFSFGETYDGLALVSMNKKEGLIDRTGREIIPVRYDKIGYYDLGGHGDYLKGTGLISVKKNDKWGAVNKSGGEILPLKYDDIGYSENGMIPVAINKKYGIIDLTGKVIIPFKYDHAYLEDDLADLVFVHLNGKRGVIDKKGKQVIPVIYDDLSYDGEGAIIVKLDKKWGFYDQQGGEIASPKFEERFHFKNGLANVTENGRNFFIDKNGIPQKKYIKSFRYDDDKIEIKGQYDQNGKKTGEWKEYYKNGQLKETCSYINGKQNGIFKRYYEDGTLWMQMDKFVNGKREGQWKSYHQNGKPWTFIQLADDKETGEWINHYKNGNVASEGKKINGKETGEWKKYYENGKLSQTGKFVNGNAAGVWKLFYDNGQLKATGEMENGKPTGEWKEYHENGKLAGAGKYSNGKPTGEWKNYNPDGSLKETKSY